jgi:hypothetical protein
LYGKSKKIERSLADIEGSFNSLRARVIAGSNDASDLRGLRFFSHLQLRRTEMAVKRIRESYEMMTENVLGDKNAVGIPDDHALIMESLHFCLSTQGYLDDLKIRVVENRTNIDFVISDDPAILMNRYAAQKLGGVGFGVVSSGLILALPISPDFAVISYDGQVYTVPDLIEGRIILTRDADVEALNELQFLKAAENIYFNSWDDREYVREQFLAYKDNRPSAWSEITHFVPDTTGKSHYRIRGEPQRYRVGTLEEGKKAGQSLMAMSFKYPVPRRWFPPLKFRPKLKTFYEGTGVGHVRKEAWLRGQS